MATKSTALVEDSVETPEEVEDNGNTDGTLLKKSGSVGMLTDVCIEEGNAKRQIPTRLIILAVVIVLFILGCIMLIVGIVMITRTPECAEPTSQKAAFANMCEPSDEGKSSGFYELLEKLKTSYYEMFPNKIVYKRPVTVEEIREKYKTYDPSPENKKRATDLARQLLKEVESFKVNQMKLKPREAKALSQALFTIKYQFGHPYDTNYYAGDYMLGPNLWCAWQPICNVGYDTASSLKYFKPSTAKDMELLRDKLAEVKAAFTQYIINLRNGVKAGMVRSIEQCKAGIDGLTSSYKNIGFNGAQGVYKEYYVAGILNPAFLSRVLNDTKESNLWKTKYGKPVNESLREFVLNYVGQPIAGLFSYLRNEHMQNCVPSSVSSGLAILPLSYVYVNGTPDKSQPTTKKLPTGEALNGKETYKMIVGYFTTNDYTPEQIYDLGYRQLNKLYPEVLKIAREVSGLNNNDTAKAFFQEKLNSTEMNHNEEPFPANESDSNAHKKCSNAKDAMKYCPNRWAAMQKWFAKAMMIISLLDPKTIEMFYFTGPKNTVPNCPIKVAADFNPSASANYHGAGASCLRSAYYNIPFFGKNFGPTYEEISTCAHEARPGHHTQVQGLDEHFRDQCGGVIGWVDSIDYYTAFGEGWGLYAENPLVAETDVYDKRPLDKYGMLKWQIWRALRLIVDSGLHSKGLSRAQSLGMFEKFAWDTSSLAQLEVTRYQSAFGQATSYMIGQQQIVKLRKYAMKELGSKYNLKEFHYQLLSQGASPLSHLKNSIERYVSCTKDTSQSGCEYVLNPPPKIGRKPTQDEGVRGDVEYRHNPSKPYRPRHYM